MAIRPYDFSLNALPGHMSRILQFMQDFFLLIAPL
jgi:hypothetical protein